MTMSTGTETAFREQQAGRTEEPVQLAVVIPVHNEEESLPELYRQLDDVRREHGYQMEVLFVDDGSTDCSWQVIEHLAKHDPTVRGIRLRRNFGKAAALRAGFDHARGELVLTMDGDLQDDPAEIPRFLEAIGEGYDVVSGWKQVRHDPWHKVWPSRVFNWMVSRLTGVKLHDHNCGMKCYRREVLQEVPLYGELHRFVPVLAAARGFRVGEIAIHHRPRKFGKSKYGVKRFVKGFLDLLTVKFITGYGYRPQHLLGTLGLVAFLLGFLGLLYLTALWFLSRAGAGGEVVHLHQRALFYYCLAALLLGGQLISIGFLAELITAHHARSSDVYSVAQRTTAASAPGERADA